VQPTAVAISASRACSQKVGTTLNATGSASFRESFFLKFLDRKSEFCYGDLSLDERRQTRPTEGGRIRLARRRNTRLKAGIQEILAGMKGWRPSAF
jgi:hypothetical protein